MGRGRESKAACWKAKARQAADAGAVELTLPSGMVIRARRPGPLQLMTWNRLPQSLAAAAMNGSGTAAAQHDLDPVELAGFLRELLLWCCLEPRVSLDPQGDDEIHPRDIPEADWTFIVNWALRAEEARALQGFRGERADAGHSSDGEAVRPAAVEPGETGGPGDGTGV